MSTPRQSIKQRFGIIGETPKLNQAIDIAVQVAPTEVTVLVVGENGSGKDAFAHIIHQLSARKHRPFIAINCGAIPEGTIDSELFGHEKGSFTSAYEARKGYFEEVNGGIIFLDEIAEMPLHTQARLLRVLENGEYLRVGSSKVQKTDVRVVAATNKNLVEAIRQGRFREDLYFRLNTVTIYVPPLRERGTDLELLFRYFAQEFAGRYGREAIQLSDEARSLLHAYHWPGNIRELRNFVEKLTVLVPSNLLSGADLEAQLPLRESRLPIRVLTGPREEPLPAAAHNGTGGSNGLESEFLLKILYDLKNEMADVKRLLARYSPEPHYTEAGGYPVSEARPAGFREVFYPAYDSARPVTIPVPPPQAELPRPAGLLEESLSIERKEKDLIAKALQKFGHNRKKAATELGISERTLYRKIKSYGLD